MVPRLFALVALALSTLVTGCASSAALHPALISEPEVGGTVILLRETGGSRERAPIQVILDGQPVASLVAGHWTSLRLVPGNHAFEVAALDDPERRPNFQSTQPGYVRETGGVGPSKAVRLELGAGEIQYLLLRYDRTATSRAREGQGTLVDTRVLFALEQVAESSAQARMQEYGEVSVEHP